VTLDGKLPPLGLGINPVQRPLRDVARRDLPAPLCESEGITPLAGSDIECTAWGHGADLVDERSIRIAAPDLLALVAIPVDLVS
jgi:hypothetical protein